MLASQIPTKFSIPFGNNADAGTIRSIPTADQSAVTPGAASLTKGFPLITGQPLASGGIPPAMQDFNGLFNQVTAWLRWQNAGATVQFDQAFCTAIGGYPQGAVVASSVTVGRLWISTADNNLTNPDGANPTNWTYLALASDILSIARPRLAANTILYVDPVNGSDTNDGSTSAKAFKTRQKAWNTVVNTLDLAGSNVLIKLLPGTYTDTFLASCPVVGNSNGVGAVTFQGSVGNNAAVVIATTGNAWLAQGGAQFALDSMAIQASGTNASGIVASVNAILAYSNIIFNPCTLNHVSAAAGGFAQQTGSVTIAGGAVNHLSAADAGSKINIAGQNITLTGTPAFTQFAAIQGPSQVTANSLALTGGATGKQYNIAGPGYLYLNGQTLPGNAAGTITTSQVG